MGKSEGGMRIQRECVVGEGATEGGRFHIMVSYMFAQLSSVNVVVHRASVVTVWTGGRKWKTSRTSVVTQ